MASIYKRGEAWYIRFRDETGRTVSRVSRADTKTAAKAEAQEAERLARRRRDGLEPMPVDAAVTLSDLCEWWLKNRCKPARAYNERARLQRYVLAAPLAALPLAKLRAGHIEDVLIQMERDGMSAATINGLRGLLRTIFSKARKGGFWTGTDPLEGVDKRKVPRRVYATLSVEEVPLLMAQVPDEWRLFFAAALHTGLRKGELCGLKRGDVDLDGRRLTVARSYDGETTKGGHADILPIADPLVPVLREALERSPSDWVFPDAKGRMRIPECDPQKVLRTALARAGIVEGYMHTCRRCKATRKNHEERHKDAAPRDCPQCGMRLWPKAQPRPVRFHDLRHTTATLLLKAGVSLATVQRLLRHSDPAITSEIYGHLDVEDMRAAVNRLAFEDMPVPHAQPAVTEVPAAVSADGLGAPLGARVVRSVVEGKVEGPEPVGFLQGSQGLHLVGETGFEPATPWSRTKCSTRLSHSPINSGARCCRALRCRPVQRGNAASILRQGVGQQKTGGRSIGSAGATNGRRSRVHLIARAVGCYTATLLAGHGASRVRTRVRRA
jgi:integrase